MSDDEIIREHNGIDTMTFSFPALENPGAYSVGITIWDNAGIDDENITGGANGYAYQFTFDLVEDLEDLFPEVVLVSPAHMSAVNDVFIVAATLQDNSGRGLDLDLSTIRLEGPDGTVIDGIQTDDRESIIGWELTNPLPTDGSADGTYTIRMRVVDKSGRVANYFSTFLYDTQVPTITSITPADESVLTIAPDQVVIVVSDGAGSGVDFFTSKGSMTLSGVADIIREDNGVDAMIFSFDAPEDTGEYVIQITLSDRAGNQHTYRSEFDFVYEPANVLPELASVDPGEWEYVNAVSQVTAVLTDNSERGLDFDLSTVRLVDPDGIEVPGIQKDDDNNTITWELMVSLATDGSADGTYTINVNAVDKDGGTNTFSSTFVYDTQVPTIISVTPADESVLTTAPDQVVIVVSDGTGSGVDFAFSKDSMTLSGVENIIREDDGVGTMIFSFEAPEDTGEYVIQITLSDRAGNQQTYQSEFDFVYEPANVLPEVALVDPAERSSVNALSQVSAVLIDNSTRGLDLDLSTIRLVGPDGVEVGGIQTDDDNDTIAWELVNPLPTDGSADGTYTINVNAVDKDGGANTFSSTFVYDTQVPIIISVTPEDGSVLTIAPDQVVIVVSDGTGSGVDFAFSRDSMTLSNVADIVREDNGVDTMTFSFAVIENTDTYTVTITLADKAGNQQTYQSDFDFVEKPEDLLPEVASVEPSDRALVNSVSQVSAVLIDNSAEGIDLDLSTIRLVGPDGVEVGGVQTDDDNDTIAWELTSPLPTDGSADGTYTVNVSAVDKAGGTTAFSSTFVYDTQVPTITSITPADGSVLTGGPSEVVIVVSDGGGSGVDFASSKASMTLSGVSDIVREDNGVDTMTFSFAAPEDIGKYTIQITLSDGAGNQQTYQSEFDLVEKTTDVLPEVTSVEPSELSFVNSLSQITAVLADKSGKGIDLDISTIRLVNPDGVEVGGVQTDNDSDTIIWVLVSPLATDGSVDGTYTISVNAVDKDGGANTFSSTFLYDTLSPSVVATTPAANDIFYEGISQATVQFGDGDGSGVDMDQTEVSLQGSNGAIQVDKSDNGKDTITLTFATLTDSGNYTIEIAPRDRAGNAGFPVQVKFSFVLKPPAIVSVSLTNRDYVSNLDSIEAVLEDRSGIGLDLTETGSSIVVTGPSGEGLQSDQTSNDVDTIIWMPVNALATDGTDDGIYTVVVTPVDTAGASGQSRQLELIYDTQPPEVVSASPADINADVTHVGQQLTAVQAQIRDEGPAGIEIEDQAIHLEALDGTQIPGVQTDDDNDTVVWNLASPLAKDGSVDGKYTVVVVATDQAGATKEFRYPLIYDTSLPQVVGVSPTDDSMLRSNTAEVSARLADSGDGEIDFQRSVIELQTPNGGSLSGVMENNGLDTIILKFAELEENGTYTVLVTAVDKAGNGADTAWKTEFVFETGLPVVLSTVPDTDLQAEAFVRTQLSSVSVTLRGTDGGGIDFSPTGSKIGLRGPDGNLIIGSQSDNGQSTLTYTLGRPRPDDGTEDGIYTILVTAVNAAKRRDEEREFSFTYDTQDPEVTRVSNLNVDANLSFVSEQITEIEVELEDEGPAGVDVDKSSLRLVNPSGNTVSGDHSDDGVDTLKIELPAGLPVEGEYSLEINAVDKAGNTAQESVAFIYSVSVPEIIATEPITIPAKVAFVNTKLNDVRAELRATGNGGIDFSSTGSTIRLRGPKGNVPGVQSTEGDVLIFTLTDPLAVDGADDGDYTISVTPVNAAKLKGQAAEFTFTYDTIPPEVDKNDIILFSGGEAGSSLTEIAALVTDDQPGSGIDWENFDSGWIKLQDSGGGEVLGEVSVNAEESTVSLLLDVPLASNGSQDGFYTVTVEPSDKSGNSPSPGVQYEFLYDTRPPAVKRAEITINEKILLLDSSLDEYPTALNTRNGVTITAIMEDDGIGADLTRSSITVTGPGGEVTGSLMQDGVSTIWLTTGLLNAEGLYNVEINPVDLHDNGSGKSAETITTQFLFEEKAPVAQLTEPTEDEEEAEDEPIELIGTAVDERSGDGIPASGVAKVEIGGTGPGGKRLDWILAEDDSDADEEPWSQWSLDFLPDASGIYIIEMRVWDEAGNFEIYDAELELEFTISLAFQGNAYCWPNPVTSGVAHISFEINAPESRTTTVKLLIYDVSGDLVYEEDHMEIPSRTRMSVEWNGRNAAGEKVATGIYVFRLEAELDDQVANIVGKPMIIKN
ncbi:Ig-like domain-containing protein [Candidatus Poribacteria bacterium]